MAWLQLIIHTQNHEVETLSEVLTGLGALSVTCQDDADTPIYEPPPGSTPLWSATKVVALFEDKVNTKELIESLTSQWESLRESHWEIQELEDRQWETQWMDHFNAIQFGRRLWICPSWQAPPDPDGVNIMLDPGLAFGTGTHPTTALCLEWLDQHPVQGKNVLDFGCGSGVLAIAAGLLGAENVWATDIDAQALLATRSNSENNKLKNKIEVVEVDQLPQLQYDILLANILANPLMELAPKFASYVKPGGHIVISGFLQHQVDDLTDHYSKWFNINERYTRDDWLALAGTRLMDT